MKFYDRESELATLNKVLVQSRSESRMTVVMGRRRIGKTELIRRCDDKTILYFFVARKAESLLCEDFAKEAEEKLNIPIGKPTRFSDLFVFLLKTSENKPFTLIIDEFQDFQRVNSSIFSEIQRDWDIYRQRGKLNLILSGSVFTMMKKIFEDYQEPLFGHANQTITVSPFATKTLKQILHDHNSNSTNEDLLALYSITGGVAWYVSLLMDNGRTTRKDILQYITERNSPFINEGRNILIEEFGPDYSMHFSILTCIASGLYTRGEMENILQNKNIGSYITRLEKYYGLIKSYQPIFAKTNSKNIQYKLNDSFLTFWFRFIYKYQAYIENGSLELLAQIIDRDYSTFSGFALERYFENKFRESGQYTRIGKFWDRKGQNEIDLIAVNEIENTAEIYEIKKDERKFDKSLLKKKVEYFKNNCDQIKKMKISTGVLTIDDM